MRILMVVHHELARDSGAAGSVLALADTYHGRGHEVRLLSYQDLPSRLSQRSKEVWFPWFVAARLRRIIKEWRPDVIDASTGDAWLWARLMAGPARDRPLLVTRSHGLEHGAHAARVREARAGRLELSWKYPLYFGGAHLWEVAASLRSADVAFFLNHEDRDYATRRLGVAAKRAHVVTNGLPRTMLGQPAPRPVDGGVRLAQVGTYMARKGVQHGAAGIVTLLRHRPDARVTFLGTGCPAATVLRDFPTELHPRLEVTPHFRRDDLPALLAGHEIKLFPTLYDGFGKTLLEAMACGLAPVTTRVAGPVELVRHLDNGLLVPPADPVALAEAVDRLLGDAPLRQRLRRRAWETAQSYTWERAAEQRLSVYRAGLRRLRRDGAPHRRLRVEEPAGLADV